MFFEPSEVKESKSREKLGEENRWWPHPLILSRDVLSVFFSKKIIYSHGWPGGDEYLRLGVRSSLHSEKVGKGWVERLE